MDRLEEFKRKLAYLTLKEHADLEAGDILEFAATHQELLTTEELIKGYEDGDKKEQK